MKHTPEAMRAMADRLQDKSRPLSSLLAARIAADMLRDIADEVGATKYPEIPGGWKLVPIKITPEMEAVYENRTCLYGTAQELHDALLAAAPSPKGDV
jgi:hypothetical protein